MLHSPQELAPLDEQKSARRSELEEELINLFARMGRIVGFPRSFAEIYGILFASPEPLAMEQIIGRAGLSQGAVSQGLRQLRALGAIQPVYVTGDRRTFFDIEDNLRKVAAGFLKEQILPQLEDWPDRIERIGRICSESGAEGNTSLGTRIEKLRGWHQRISRSTPELLQLIGKWS